jgi:hypothetical protein
MPKHGLKAGAIGRIVYAHTGGHTTVYEIDFGTGQTVELPGGWLAPAPVLPASTRRPPLFLHAPKDERDEASRQTEGITFLESHGYEVDEVAKTRKGTVCKCGQFVTPKGYQGTTPGTPDTAISHPRYPGTPRVVLTIEWKKRPWTVDSKPLDDREEEQLRRLQCGRNAGAWDLPSLCLAVTRWESSLGIDPLPGLLEKLT